MMLRLLILLISLSSYLTSFSQPYSPSSTNEEMLDRILDHEASAIHDEHRLCGNHKRETRLKSKYKKESKVHTELLNKFNLKYPPREEDVVKTRGDKKYQIPILFHFMAYNRSSHFNELIDNFTGSRVESALKSLNEFYAETDVEFCLATHYEVNGKREPLNLTGVIDQSRWYTDYIRPSQPGIPTTNMIFGYDQFDEEVKAPTIIDPEHILNIWTVDPATLFWGFAYGYGMFPNFFTDPDTALPGFHPTQFDQLINGWDDVYIGNHTNDGIFIQTPLVGSGEEYTLEYINGYREEIGLPAVTKEDFALYEGYKEGGILAHEVGHYLGLFHTFGTQSTCEDGPHGDFVSDTPIHYRSTTAACSYDIVNSLLDFIIPGEAPKICQPGEDEPSFPQDPEEQFKIAANLMSYDLDRCKKSVGPIVPLTAQQIARINHTMQYASNRINLGVDSKGNKSFCLPKEKEDIKQQLIDFIPYPNPVRNKLVKIQVDANNKDKTLIKYIRVDVINSLGQEVKTHYSEYHGAEGIRVDLSDLPAGAYYLRIEYDKNETVTKKIIKQ